MEEFKAELVGEEIWAKYGDFFPLLVKFLDCDKRLPAHMHPTDAVPKALGMRDPAKPRRGILCGLMPERALIAALCRG